MKIYFFNFLLSFKHFISNRFPIDTQLSLSYTYVLK